MAEPDVNMRRHLLSRWWASHPRYMWFCGLAPHARLLDCGGGPGGIPLWCEEANRKDIVASIVDRSPHGWTGYDFAGVADLSKPKCLSSFSEGSFDAVLFSHVVEHLEDPSHVMEEIWRVLKVGGTMYLETMTPASLNHMSMFDYRQMHTPAVTTRFDDDTTHVKCYEMGELFALADAHDFKVKMAGTIRNRFIEHAMLQFGRENQDAELCTYGIYSQNELAQFMIADRVLDA